MSNCAAVVKINVNTNNHWSFSTFEKNKNKKQPHKNTSYFKRIS